MEIEAIGAVPSPRRPLHFVGVSAEVGEARAAVREATPRGHWDGVLAEVSRLQREESMSPLAALQAVHAKLASGWLPPATH